MDQKGTYLVMMIAGLVGAAVLLQFVREIKASLPDRPRDYRADDYDDY